AGVPVTNHRTTRRMAGSSPPPLAAGLGRKRNRSSHLTSSGGDRQRASPGTIADPRPSHRQVRARVTTTTLARAPAAGRPPQDRVADMISEARPAAVAVMAEMTAADLDRVRTDTGPVRIEDADSSSDRTWFELARPTAQRRPDRPVGRRWIILRVVAAAVVVV